MSDEASGMCWHDRQRWRIGRLFGLVLSALLIAVLGVVALAEDNANPQNGAQAAENQSAQPMTPTPAEKQPEAMPIPEQILGPPRRLAPGVLITIPPDVQVDETHNRQDIVELVTADPQLDWAKGVDFRREVYCLEFQFKLPRLIQVDLPQPSGKLQRKTIWYLIYKVTNRGGALRPVPEDDGTYRVDSVDIPVRFVPTFYLEAETPSGIKRYPDRVIPLAKQPIQMREDSNINFYDSTQVSTRELAVGQSIWGVATWEDVDPSIDKFSILVVGLSNAYRWQDPPGAYKAGDPIGQGRRFERKILQLNFWRPGDEFILREDAIRFGQPGTVDYAWIYR
jgi:hypothetical protein